jgi:hypothetical protein
VSHGIVDYLYSIDTCTHCTTVVPCAFLCVRKTLPTRGFQKTNAASAPGAKRDASTETTRDLLPVLHTVCTVCTCTPHSYMFCVLYCTTEYQLQDLVEYSTTRPSHIIYFLQDLPTIVS